MTIQNTGRLPASHLIVGIKREVIDESEDISINSSSNFYKGVVFLIWFILCFFCIVIALGILSTSSAFNPTESPTKLADNNPSTSPILNPTESPTKLADNNPSTSPILNPTESPTKLPTNSPSVSPTFDPTVSPTRLPTTSPSVSPTLNPTVTPTKLPTNSPSVSPTLNPTVTPTKLPTNSPSVSPTFDPTVFPTERDFCMDYGKRDEDVRRELYEKHILATGATGRVLLQYVQNLKCLPENALALFSGVEFYNIQDMTIKSGIEKIHPDAFTTDVGFIQNIKFLDLSENELEELPDAVFSSFEKLRFLNLNYNKFKTLNNNILQSSSTLQYAYLSYVEYLEEFPEFIQDAPNLRMLYVYDAPNLSVTNSEAFKGLQNLKYLVLQRGSSSLTSLDKGQIAESLMIPKSSIYLAN